MKQSNYNQNDENEIKYKGPVPAHKPKNETVIRQAQPTEVISSHHELEIKLPQSRTDLPQDKTIHNTNDSSNSYINSNATRQVGGHAMQHLVGFQRGHFRRRGHHEEIHMSEEKTTQLPEFYVNQKEQIKTTQPLDLEGEREYVEAMFKNLEKYQNLNEDDMDVEYMDIQSYSDRFGGVNDAATASKSVEKRTAEIKIENLSAQDDDDSAKKNGFWSKPGKKFSKIPDDNGQKMKTLSDSGKISDSDVATEKRFSEKDYEYKNATEIKEKIKYINSLKFIQTAQAFLLSIVFIFSLFITYSAYSVAPVAWKWLSPMSASTTFYLMNFLIMLLGICISARTIFYGLKDFFVLKATNDSMLSILSISSLIFSLYILITHNAMEDPGIHYYNSIVIAGLLINCVGKIFVIQKTKDNFDFMVSAKNWKAAELVRDGDLQDEMVKILGESSPSVAVSVKTGFLRRFLELSLSTDSVENIDKIVSPVCFVCALTLSVGAYLVHRNVSEAVSLFIACICVCAPFTSSICSALPIYNSAKTLRRSGAMISGNSAVYDFYQTNAIVVDAAELFPKGTVSLQALKTFEGGRIDESIIDATSVVYSIASTLSGMFMGIIENRANILSPVDTIVYEDEMGISAWVNGRRVLIGNRDLLLNHDIEVPSEEYEYKYKSDGKELVYLATSGVLSAMYVVKYHGDKKICDLLKRLTKKRVNVVVRTTDPNITPDKLSQIFGIPSGYVRVVPDRGADRYKNVTKPRTKVDAKLSYNRGVIGFLTGILESLRLGATISLLSTLQMIGMILGYMGIAFCAFFSGIPWLTPFRVLMYNSFWSLIIVLISQMRKSN